MIIKKVLDIFLKLLKKIIINLISRNILYNKLHLTKYLINSQKKLKKRKTKYLYEKYWYTYKQWVNFFLIQQNLINKLFYIHFANLSYKYINILL